MVNPFIPHELPLEQLDWKRLVQPVGEASSALSRYDGILLSMINPAVLLSPITTREAVLSSKIEGTVATLDEVLQLEAGSKEYDEKKTQDIVEVLNYRKALLAAEEALAQRPLSLNLIKAVHKILMDGARGEDKSPGQFRSKQNWIGKPRCKIEEARFVPPNPMILQEHLEKWQWYIQEHKEEALIQMAVIHAQFEILHPFEDGNGRIGRILIPLYLFQREVLHRPMFYLSEYLESNRDEYYDRLLAVTKENDWQGWIEFFLAGIIKQANSNTEKAKRIKLLYETLKAAFRETTHSEFATPALDTFFSKPIINSTDFFKRSGISTAATANTILRKLYDAGYLHLMRQGSGSAPSVYSLPELLNTSEGREAFPVKTRVLT